MEQQKILWIILSVAVLLLVVLGTALFVFGPASSDKSAGMVQSGEPAGRESFDPIEWARTGSDYPGITEAPAEGDEESEFIVVYGEELPKDETAPASSGSVVSLSVKKEEPAAQKQTAPAPSAPVAPKQAAPAVKPAPAPSAPAAAAPKKEVTEYWIQAGSFSTLTRAEEARNALSGKGFPATIQTRNVDGKDFYRVRIGSYGTKDEADKFLYWVKDIDGFNQSYVSQVKALR